MDEKEWNQEKFGNRILELRTKLKLSQTEFGKKVGFSAQTISKYERGEKNPQIENVVKIALAYDVSLDWLCDIEKMTDTGIKQTINDDEDALKTILQLTNFYKDKFVVKSGSFCINEGYVREYFKDFEIMKVLRDKGTIKDEMFNTWALGRITEVLEKYRNESNEIDEIDEINPKELPF